MILAFFICILLIVLVAYSKIQIEVRNINVDLKKNNENNKNIYTQLNFKIFNINLIKIKLDKDKIDRIIMKQEENIKKIEMKDFKVNKERIEALINNKKIKDQLKKCNIKLKMLKINLKEGTGDVITTSYIISILSTLLSILLPFAIENKKDIRRCSYKIIPVYNNEITLNLQLSIALSINILHTIKLIYLIISNEKVKNRQLNNQKKPFKYSFEL